MNTENLNRKAKIELIKRIQSGKVKVINGEIFGQILVSKDGVYYFNDKPVKPEDLHKIEQGEETIIVLPAKMESPE